MDGAGVRTCAPEVLEDGGKELAGGFSRVFFAGATLCSRQLIQREAPGSWREKSLARSEFPTFEPIRRINPDPGSVVFRREICYDPLPPVIREYSLESHVDRRFRVVPWKFVESQSRLARWKTSHRSYVRRLDCLVASA